MAPRRRRKSRKSSSSYLPIVVLNSGQDPMYRTLPGQYASPNYSRYDKPNHNRYDKLFQRRYDKPKYNDRKSQQFGLDLLSSPSSSYGSSSSGYGSGGGCSGGSCDSGISNLVFFLIALAARDVNPESTIFDV